MSQKILIVEDDIHISKIIKMNLNLVNYETTEAYDGLEALEALKRAPFDLILLDVMIPHMDGFELMENIRPYRIPVIFLTAKNSVYDKVNGLKLGADDYIVKPFEAIELLARIEAVLRRYGKEERLMAFQTIQVDLDKREVLKQGIPVELTPKEYDLLVVLLKNKNIALSREQFIEKVWGYDYYGETRTVDMHIKSLRKKLDLQDHIKTIYKMGYRLED
ncbi:response regulator transcription factor [Paenibacillus alvei]|uniref:Response regulator transcription factor n=1 Tax=Paenibacillus alvei TaxID=44250 RepID=A0ABT4H063_PAEAL|nr:MULTISPECIES: response regulator transcription factor [Paenibacillus]EJW15136.1 putative transcriptional regulatory protein yclJ [Paenibacillus alvei DSM 29]MCY7484645.1 response regulator transcription factor [Paenibacillus alvei]MCY9543944.1 response regulator transcription factor [Paenibacillus alvei]MCY9705941.1 response regulator transcription factor [Paenibacillus alvei]MCY9737745.1 response regulator transcription factor [Paenibacillus alvei]